GKLLGTEKYRRFLTHVIRDGRHFEKINKVRTEILLKYILIAVSGIPDETNLDDHLEFLKQIVHILRNIVISNQNISDLDTMFDTKDIQYIQDEHNNANKIYT